MAKAVRFWPVTWNNSPCMRVEIYGSEANPDVDQPQDSQGATNVSVNIKVISDGFNYLRVQLSAVSPTNGSIKGYSITLEQQGGAIAGNYSTFTSCHGDSVDFRNLEENTKYCAYVTPFTQNGRGNTSSCIPGVTGEKAKVNFTAFNESSTSIKVSWDKELPFPVEDGEERGYIIDYHKDSQLHSIVVCSSTPSLVLRDLLIFTNYCISVASFNSEVIDTQMENFLCVHTDEEAPNGPPMNITARNTSSTTIEVNWKPILKNLQNGYILGYHITFKKQPEVVPNRRRRSISDNELVTVHGEHNLTWTLDALEKFTRYCIEVKGFNRIGDGNASEICVKTDEDVPSKPPEPIIGYNTSSTSLYIEWSQIPPEYIHGILLGYRIFFGVDSAVNSPHIDIDVGTTEFSKDFEDLDSYTKYCVRMAGVTRIGAGNKSECVVIRTDEDIPSSAPSHVSVISMTSTDSMNVTWDPLPLSEIRGRLLGYRIEFENKTEDGSWQMRHVMTCRNATHFSLTGLNMQAKYRIKIAATTGKGVGPFSEPVCGETCSCPATLHSAVHPSLLNEQGPDGHGSLADVIESLVTEACGFCHAHGQTILIPLPANDTSEPDISFPVMAAHDHAEGPGAGHFVPVIQVPGLAVIQRKPNETGAYDKVIGSSVFHSWSIFAMTGILTLLAGLIIWILEVNSNQEEFPPQFFKGAGEGLWWAFITMTTLGYGDRTPTTNLGKAFAMVWFLVGLVMFSIFSGALTASLTVVVVSGGPSAVGSDTLLYVSVMKDSVEKHIALRKLINRFSLKEEYEELEDLVDSLKNGNTDAILLDMYVPVRRTELFNGTWFEVTEIVENEMSHGIELRGEAVGLAKALEDMIQSQNVQTTFLVDEEHEEHEEDDHAAEEEEEESGVVFFEPSSPYFLLILEICGGALGGLMLFGLIFECCWRAHNKKTSKTKATEAYHQHKEDLKQILEDFYQNFTRTYKAMRKKNEAMVNLIKKSRAGKLRLQAKSDEAHLW